MLAKIISFFVAIFVGITGIGSSATAAGVEGIFSKALSLVAERSAFIDDMSDKDVSQFDEGSGYIRNMLLVFFEENASFFSRLSALGEIGGAVIGSMPEAELCVVRTVGLDYAELSALAEKATALEAVALAGVCGASKIEEQYTPDDPFSVYDWYTEYWEEDTPAGNNWWLEAIEARAAWGYDCYYNEIPIGIVDGGFEVGHEDLAGKISFPSSREEKRNRSSYHGTHVAGIIAANADNGIGISGICQNSSLICVDWKPSDGQLWIGDVEIFFGFGKAVKAGAKVINFSLGSSGSLGENQHSWSGFVNWINAAPYSCYMAALLNKGYDFVVVQSAGNGNSDGKAVDALENGCFCPITRENAFVPYSGVSVDDVLDRIIVVGSALNNGGNFRLAASSNVGKRVDICAPGVNIYSCSTDGYFNLSGTSMAAPVVTAVASLVWSVDESLSGADVKRIVCTNTCDTAEPAEEYFFEDVLDIQSYPMVNARLAVEAALENKYEMNTVTLECEPYATVKFTAENADEYVFEADSSGKLECLLESGAYGIEINTVVIHDSFAVEGDTNITLSGE